MRHEPLRGRPTKPHHAAANADREDDHAPGNGISKLLALDAIRRRMAEVGKRVGRYECPRLVVGSTETLRRLIVDFELQRGEVKIMRALRTPRKPFQHVQPPGIHEENEAEAVLQTADASLRGVAQH